MTLVIIFQTIFVKHANKFLIIVYLAQIAHNVHHAIQVKGLLNIQMETAICVMSVIVKLVIKIIIVHLVT